MELRLIDFFPSSELIEDCLFSVVDQVDSVESGAVAYAATIPFVRQALLNPNIVGLIVPPSLEAEAKGKGLVVSEEPRTAFFDLYSRLRELGRLSPFEHGSISESASIAPTAVVSPLARVGEHVKIEAGAVIGDFSIIGDHCCIGQNAVVGAEGLMPIVRDGSRRNLSFAGHVELGSGVSILAGAVIVRSVFRQPTLIGDHSSIGVLSSVGHDCRFAEEVTVSANCMISGGVRIGRGASIWSSSSIAQGIEVGERAEVLMGSVVIKDIQPGERVSGNYSIPHRQRISAMLKEERNR